MSLALFELINFGQSAANLAGASKPISSSRLKSNDAAMPYFYQFLNAVSHVLNCGLQSTAQMKYDNIIKIIKCFFFRFLDDIFTTCVDLKWRYIFLGNLHFCKRSYSICLIFSMIIYQLPKAKFMHLFKNVLPCTNEVLVIQTLQCYYYIVYVFIY